jgi:hypothetical protein
MVKASYFKRIISSDWICLEVVWLNKPWSGNETVDLKKYVLEFLMGI